MAAGKFKIVDSFLFSEVYEEELLLLKLMLEDDGVHEWVLLENAYSFQGEYTGLHAAALINGDERFAPYRHKIKIISAEKETRVLPKHEFLDKYTYEVEFWQRDLVYDYFMQHYRDEDWIMISDVDEMIDLTSDIRKQELYEKMSCSPDGLLKVPTKRYWYDFDNEYRMLIGNAMCNKKYLLNTKKMLHEVRMENRRVTKNAWRNIVEFEYSSCYAVENMLRKFYTSTHTGFTPNDLQRSLRCNHRPTRELATWKADNNKYWFFETVELTEKNSPAIVRENLAYYKTNAIDPDYRENRRKEYPELFKASYFIKRFFAEQKYKAQKKMKALRHKLKV